MTLHRGTLVLSAALAAAAVVAALLLRPKPLRVELGTVHDGPLEVTVEDQAETRVRDRYVVAAPVAGRLLRVLLRDGDRVERDETVATLAPLPLTAREYDEATARVEAASGAERSAVAHLRRATEELEQARRERERLEKLTAQGVSSRQSLERARTSVATLELEVTAARHRVLSAAAELRGARAALAASEDARRPGETSIPLRAPASGRVLRVLEPSERVLSAGTAILVIGELSRLEVVAEMLSSEAVKISAGMPALLTGWGGERPLRARVRLVEPYAYTKVSALGVEEKRTNVILDFVDAPGPLGDGYRVTARIILWSSPRVLQAPLGAFFRCGSQWCAYALAGGRVRLRHVRIGHRSEDAAEILAGLKVGDRVVLHPPNELEDKSRVATD